MALAKHLRLSKKKDFKAVIERGRRAYGKLITLIVLENGLTNRRFGIIISSKVSKKAVERNKIRRRIVEIIRVYSNSLIEGFDAVILTKPDILGKKRKVLEEELLSLFKKLGIEKVSK